MKCLLAFRGLPASKQQWRPEHAAAAALLPARRGIFSQFWRPKPPSDAPLPPSQQTHHKLWGAKTGTGSLNPPPHRAIEDLVGKLEAAHYCTQQLRGSDSGQRRGPRSSGSFVVVPAYVPVGLDAPLPHAAGNGAKGHGQQQHLAAPRFGEEPAEDLTAEEGHMSTRASDSHHHYRLQQQHLEAMIEQHCAFRLRRLPSTLPGAGLGLFLTSGKVKEGAVLTLYPGLIYRIPYDLERAMQVDEVSLTPCPPGFLLKNDYLLRFHHEPTGHHLLLDGCPRGVSALNFIKTSQRRACLGANMDWLESTSKACGLRPTHGGHDHPGSDYLTATAAGGEKFVLLPAGAEAADPAKYFTSSLGMGHMINDPGDLAEHNAEFHCLELPHDLPPHLLRYLPNLNYSDALGDRRFAVLVTAARDLEVPKDGAPIELFVPYNQQASCRHGFPLL